MGTIYCGPYADAIGYEDHEGYSARILPDGTETSTWTAATREFTGYRAHCACGWRGTGRYPATTAGEGAADDEWDHDHLRPLISAEAARHTVPATRVVALINELRAGLTTTRDARGREVLSGRSCGVLDVVEQLEQLLDELATRGRR